jgi:glycosyltransferase involved in cell wall biosynthesis
MISKPRIDVIMSVYNGEKHLREAIESILNQTYTNFKLIIIDDSSNDGSLGIINSFADERIEVIRNKNRKGLTRNLNKALEMAEGKYVARQDADDVSLPSRFESQVAFLEKHPEVDVLGTASFLIDEKGNEIKKTITHPTPSRQIFLERNEVFHGSAMIKREALEATGGYNELFKYSQDYELWLRLAKENNVRNLQTPLYAFRIHKSSISLKKTREQFLFAIFARKIAKKELVLDGKLKKAIAKGGIGTIFPLLTFKEKLQVYRTSIKRQISGRLMQTKTGRALLDFYHRL